jgi:uncharacterized membrane protein YsdA (DUF1294 family)/cold shock CspA family protein
MMFQGKIINWNDDKGFGFVEPNGGGDRAFVHIKAFGPGARRPVNGEAIIYDLAMDNNQRYRAEKIKFARDFQETHFSHSAKRRDASRAKSDSKSDSRSGVKVAFTLLFWLGLIVGVLTNRLPPMLVGIYLAMSGVAFIAYAIDKSAAQAGRWRTQESTLHLFSLVGGWPGALFAQSQLRHKSKKKAFLNVYWVTVLFNIGGLLWLLTDNGAQFINKILGNGAQFMNKILGIGVQFINNILG